MAIAPVKSSSETSLPADAVRATNLGKQAAQAGGWGAAIEHFRKAEQLAPDFPLPTYNLALAYDKAGGRELMALAYYRAYLASKQAKRNRQQVEGRVEELERAIERRIDEVLSTVARLVRPFKRPGFDRLAEVDIALGRFELAQQHLQRYYEYINSRKYDHQWQKILNYRNIAPMMVKAGDYESAKRLAKLLSPMDTIRVYAEIIKHKIRKGEIALRLIEEMKDIGYKNHLDSSKSFSRERNRYENLHTFMGDIALEYAARRDHPGADVASESIPPNARADVMVALAAAYVRAGDIPGAQTGFNNAKANLNNSKDRTILPERVQTWMNLANIQLEAKDAQSASSSLQSAYQDASKLPESDAKDKKLRLLAMMFCKVNDPSRAAQAAENIKKPIKRDAARASVIPCFLKRGDIAQAKSLLQKVFDSGQITKKSYPSSLNIFPKVGEAFAAAGEVDLAKTVIKRVNDRYWETGIRRHLAMAYIRQDRINDALQLLESIEAIHKPHSYAWIAAQLSGLGRQADSERFYELALQAALNSKTDLDRSIGISTIVTSRLEVQDIQGARKLAERITENRSKGRALIKISEALAKMGDLHGAYKLFALGISSGMPEISDFGAHLQELKSKSSEQTGSKLLCAAYNFSKYYKAMHKPTESVAYIRSMSLC